MKKGTYKVTILLRNIPSPHFSTTSNLNYEILSGVFLIEFWIIQNFRTEVFRIILKVKYCFFFDSDKYDVI